MERRFREDFSHVRIHTDVSAARSAADVSARAYTIGSHIVFGQRGSPSDRRLLAHELAHTLQQDRSLPSPGLFSGSVQEAEATRRAAAALANRLVPAPTRGGLCIARQREGESFAGEDEEFRVQEAEDKRGKRVDHRKRQSRVPATTGGAASRQAERQILQMIADAERGDYRHVNTKKRQIETNRFRKLVEMYRSSELARIDSELNHTPAGDARDALVKNKREIIKERSEFKGKFDEAMRTPAGAMVQQKYIHGAEAKTYHETEPGRGSYAQPDYTITGSSERGGVERLHVNLKSHDLRDLTEAGARKIAREVLAQATKNVSGKPSTRGSVGHLPAGDRLIISFIDQPPVAIQQEMNRIMLAADGPISEVRFGTATYYRQAPPALALKPPTPGGGPPGPSGGSHPPSLATPTLKQQSTPASGGSLAGSHRAGRATVDVDVEMLHQKRPLKVSRLDLADFPPPRENLSADFKKGTSLQSVVSGVQLGRTILSLAAMGSDKETQEKLEKIISPIQSYFFGELREAQQQFHLNFPEANELLNASNVEQRRLIYEATVIKRKSNLPKLVLVMLRFDPDVTIRQAAMEALDDKPSIVHLGEAGLKKARDAGYSYMESMADVQTRLSKSITSLAGVAEDIEKRASILEGAGEDLESLFWKIMNSPAAGIPVVYYEALGIYGQASFFKSLGAGLSSFAGQIKTRVQSYQGLFDRLDRTQLELARFLGLEKPA